VRWAALVLVALALSGCETTAEKSAKLEKEAKAHAGILRAKSAPITITRESTKIKVSGASIVHSREGNAAIVILRNSSPTAVRNVPIQIIVKDAHGASLYTNAAAGLAPSLTAAPLVPAHGTLTWVDDQVQGSATPASVSARVGEGEVAKGAVPELVVQGAHLGEEATSGPVVEGSVVNHSHTSQRQLVVYALARRGAAVVAAGRSVLPEVTAGASTRFQVYFIGDPHGAQLQLSAPPTTLG
jgi:hypothetical protein